MLNEITKGSLKKIRGALYTQFIQASEFLLELSGEIEFICICNQYILSMMAKGLPLCFPKASECQHISGLYSAELATYKAKSEIVANDVYFDDDGKPFILAGANSGGKSVYLRSIGIAQVLFQLGLPITAVPQWIFLKSTAWSFYFESETHRWWRLRVLRREKIYDVNPEIFFGFYFLMMVK